MKNSEDELRKVTFVSDRLNDEISNDKNLLSQKEIKLSEAECKLTATENEKLELQKIVEDLKMENDEVKMIRDDQERQILKLSEDNDHLSKENECLGEANREHEVKLHQLLEEHEKTKNRDESLISKIATVFQALLEKKVHELTKACKNLEDESTSKDMDVELLKERINILEGDNGVLKSQLAVYVPAINSLNDCISSMENHMRLHRELKKSNNREVEDAELANHCHVKRREKLSADQKWPEEFSELHDLETRVKAVSKAVIEMETLDTRKR
ncbi:hypothetical protein U1Q18_007673 [Sarracenia purpurea var. burkii]